MSRPGPQIIAGAQGYGAGRSSKCVKSQKLSYVSGLRPCWDPKLIAKPMVRSLGFRVLLSYYVAEERGASL